MRTGIARMTRRTTYFVIGSGLGRGHRTGDIGINGASGQAAFVPANGYCQTSMASRIALGALAMRAPRAAGRGSAGSRSPDQPFLNQSAAFHVGPAWVGFAKKFPGFGPASSTFFR